jgi:hypothetical protein
MEIYFLWFWRLEVQDQVSGRLVDMKWGEGPLLIHMWCLLTLTLHSKRVRALTSKSFIMTLIPIMRPLFSWPKPLPKIHPPNTTLFMKISQGNLFVQLRYTIKKNFKREITSFWELGFQHITLGQTQTFRPQHPARLEVLDRLVLLTGWTMSDLLAVKYSCLAQLKEWKNAWEMDLGLA